MEKKYVVMEFITWKDTEITDRYCYIMNEDEYFHFRRSYSLDSNLYTITDTGVFERETYTCNIKITVNIFKAGDVIIHNEIHI